MLNLAARPYERGFGPPSRFGMKIFPASTAGVHPPSARFVRCATGIVMIAEEVHHAARGESRRGTGPPAGPGRSIQRAGGAVQASGRRVAALLGEGGTVDGQMTSPNNRSALSSGHVPKHCGCVAQPQCGDSATFGNHMVDCNITPCCAQARNARYQPDPRERIGRGNRHIRGRPPRSMVVTTSSSGP